MDRSNQSKTVRYSLRQVTPEDYRFAETLYLETSQSLFEELGSWDRPAAVRRFEKLSKSGNLWLILVDGTEVGWLQRSETDEEIRLDEIHIRKEFRSAGIGSQCMRDLLEEARNKKCAVSLSVLTNNPAQTLYQRFGFRILSESNQRYHMRWDPSEPNSRE